MENFLLCKVCLVNYDNSSHKPYLLPKCGHTFCIFCIDSLKMKKILHCPECRTIDALSGVLPTNYALVSLLNATNTQHEPISQDKSNSNANNSSVLGKTKGKANQKGDDMTALQSFFNRMTINTPRQSSCTRAPYSIPNQQSSRRTTSRLHTIGANSLNSHTRRSLLPTPSQTVTQLSNNSTDSSTTSENISKETLLQQELDFQMAVHLTFCKDMSHNHDNDALSAVSVPWKYPLDDDMITAMKRCGM